MSELEQAADQTPTRGRSNPPWVNQLIAAALSLAAGGFAGSAATGNQVAAEVKELRAEVRGGFARQNDKLDDYGRRLSELESRTRELELRGARDK